MAERREALKNHWAQQRSSAAQIGRQLAGRFERVGEAARFARFDYAPEVFFEGEGPQGRNFAPLREIGDVFEVSLGAERFARFGFARFASGDLDYPLSYDEIAVFAQHGAR